MASNEPPSPRTWAMVTAGIAVASSAVTLVSVLGFQHLHRRRMRHDLEDNVRRSLSQRQFSNEGSTTKKGSSSTDVANEKETSNHQQDALPHTSTPRYLTALAEQQSQNSHIHSPRPSTRAAAPSPSVPHIHRASTPNGPRHSTAANRRMMQQQATEYDESLIREQLSRNYSFLGDEAMHSLRNSFVIVVGAGGVGSWCALMLLRSGIGRLRLIDFDQVSLSSLNRHACATLADVGRPKVDVCKEKFGEIAPWCDVDARVDIFRGTEAARLLAPAKADASHNLTQCEPTFVVDCIDNLDTKVDLLAFCYHQKIPCFSSMGAGAKADPSQIQVADLNSTAEDPLARRVRRALRAKGVWGGGVMANKAKGKGSKKGKASKAQNEDDTNVSPVDRKRKQEEALQKLQSSQGSNPREIDPSALPAKKFEHSGRGASDSNNDVTKRWSEQSAPPVSRRASSTSSAGSVYFSPSSTPMNEEEPQQDEGDKDDVTVRQPSLPEEKDFDLASTSRAQSTSQSANDFVPVNGHGSPKRPVLSMLQQSSSTASSSPSPSRRASSLAELEAEEMRTKSANGPSSRNHLTTHAEEEEEEVFEEEEDEQEGENPYTIMCVYTNEKSDTRLLPLDEEEFKKGDVEELAALEDFRVRILPVLGPLPAMFGLAAATYIICHIAGRPLEPLPFKGRRKTAERLFMELETSERRYPLPGSENAKVHMALGPKRVPWTIEDVAYVFEEVFRCRSVVPPHETLSIGKLLRWDSTLPLSYSNVALFTRTQGQQHEEQVLKHGRSPIEVWGEEAARMFKRRMAEERRMNILR